VSDESNLDYGLLADPCRPGGIRSRKDEKFGGLLFTFSEFQGNHPMRIVGLFRFSRVVPVLFLLLCLGFAAGCGDSAKPVSGGPSPDSKAKEEAEKAARMKNYGTKTGIPPSTKKEAESAPKQ
jgi:hypothetical protein